MLGNKGLLMVGLFQAASGQLSATLVVKERGSGGCICGFQRYRDSKARKVATTSKKKPRVTLSQHIWPFPHQKKTGFEYMHPADPRWLFEAHVWSIPVL
jgi:hypothetical protein